MSMRSLFHVVAMRDPRKHNIVLCSKAKLTFVLYTVTCDFSTPCLIVRNDASL